MIANKNVIWLYVSVYIFLITGCSNSNHEEYWDNSPVSNFYGVDSRSIEVDASGGTAEVRFAKYVPLILASGNEACRINYGTGDLTPETFGFSPTDIVNLIPDFLGCECVYTQETDAMTAGGATILVDADEIDYGWMRAEITQERVKVDVSPNETGDERRVFLVFYPEFSWFNDVITVRQSAD